MGWTIPPGSPGVLLHFSEDPLIRSFVPHVPRSNPTATAAVWAIDPAHAALYWFPRDCPRVAVWANDRDQAQVLRREFSTDARRLHVVPNAWVEAVGKTHLYEYRFDPAPFEPWPDAEGQWVAHEPVVPESVEPVGDLVARHAAAGIELRFVDNLEPMSARVVGSGLPFSIVRFRRP
jgi:hypothetical protein